jgi:hypothetical protein
MTFGAESATAASLRPSSTDPSISRAEGRDFFRGSEGNDVADGDTLYGRGGDDRLLGGTVTTPSAAVTVSTI